MAFVLAPSGLAPAKQGFRFPATSARRVRPSTMRPCVARPFACAGDEPMRPADGWRDLEQAWRFQQRNGTNQRAQKPLDCPDCRASGAVECRFCSATGVLTLGDKLLCSVEGGTVCPVCNGKGETRCQKCAGSGHIAGWIVQ